MNNSMIIDFINVSFKFGIFIILYKYFIMDFVVGIFKKIKQLKNI